MVADASGVGTEGDYCGNLVEQLVATGGGEDFKRPGGALGFQLLSRFDREGARTIKCRRRQQPLKNEGQCLLTKGAQVCIKNTPV